MWRHEEADACAGVQLEVVRTLYEHIRSRAALEHIAVLLAVVKLHIDRTQACLQFGHDALRARDRVHDPVEIEEDRAVAQPRVIALLRLEGDLRADTETRR